MPRADVALLTRTVFMVGTRGSEASQGVRVSAGEQGMGQRVPQVPG